MATIKDIYQKYQIMPLLQDHQIRAAALGNYILDFWQGKQVPIRDVVTQALLLHDMGNIIKFDLSKPMYPGEQLDNNIHWKRVQEQYLIKYGTDEHIATYKIAKEVGVSERVIEVIKSSGSSKLKLAIEKDDMYAKICSYADLRCAPYGVVSVNQRFDDILKRYKDRSHTLSDRRKTEEKRKYCLVVEQDLQTSVAIGVNQITDRELSQYKEQMWNYTI